MCSGMLYNDSEENSVALSREELKFEGISDAN